MNIRLFLESLSEDEKKELSDLLKKEILKLDFNDYAKGKITIEEFINTYKMSGRLRTTLERHLEY